MHTVVLRRWSRRFGAAFAMASCLLLTACTPPPAPPPRAPAVDQLNALIRQAIDNHWMTDNDAEAVPRGDVEPLHPEGGRRRTGILVECRGVSGRRTIQASIGGLRFDPLEIHPQARGAEPFALCRARMSSPDIAVYLYGERQLRYLYSYFVERLRPCLLHAGFDVLPPPSLHTFIREFPDVGWTPYQSLGVAGDSPGREVVEARCPPRPPALDW